MIKSLFNPIKDSLISLYSGDAHRVGGIFRALSTPSHLSIRVNTLRGSIDSIVSRLESVVSFRMKSVTPIPEARVIECDGPQNVCDDVDKYPLSVIVGRLCGESVMTGANVYSAGIAKWPNTVPSPDSLLRIYTDTTDKILRGGITRERDIFSPPDYMFLGLGKVVLSDQFKSRSDIFSKNKKGQVIEMMERVWPFPSLNGVMEGEIVVQSLPSQIVSRILDPKAGERILDMCAPPGGKTAHIACLMENQGEIVAIAQTSKKVEELRKVSIRDGITILKIVKLNALKAENYFEHGSFHRVLLDPPCSGIGRRPQLNINGLPTAFSLEEHAELQRKMIKGAQMLVKPGGILVYSTCTVNPGENECNIRWALDNFDLELDEIDDDYKHIGNVLPGLIGQHMLSEKEAEKVLRFEPTDERNGLNGFFIAKLRKKLK